MPQARHNAPCLAPRLAPWQCWRRAWSRPKREGRLNPQTCGFNPSPPPPPPMPRRHHGRHRHGEHLHLPPALRRLHLRHGRQARPVARQATGRTREAGQGRTQSRQATRPPPRPPPSTLSLWPPPMQVVFEMRFEHVDSREKSDRKLS
jgi:hypothetical protein